MFRGPVSRPALNQASNHESNHGPNHGEFRMTGYPTDHRRRATMLAAALFATAIMVLAPPAARAQTTLQAGVLVCEGEGGWGLIIASTKSFSCTFSSSNGAVRESYYGIIDKFGLDIGVTGRTSLTWLVFGPAASIGPNYAPGTLAGTYGGAGAEASVGLGVGANALVGGGPGSFTLQPVSVQVQTGLSVAAAVQTLTLDYAGPLN